MARTPKRRSQKAGLPPGTLVHIGEKKTDKVRIRLITYNESDFQDTEGLVASGASSSKDPKTVTWLDIGGIHHLDVIEAVGKSYGLHPLLLEDIVNTDQRPKLDDYGAHLFLVLKMLYPEEGGKLVRAEQVSLVAGPDFVLSFQENGIDVFGPIRERLRTGKGRIRSLGADYLLYSLIDAIVDNYFTVLELLGERIERLEDELVADCRRETLHTIHAVKRELLFLRRSVWPLREVISGLARGESSLIQPGTHMYLRDVYDHTIQVIDTIEAYRDMTASMLDIYLSSMSNQITAVMKVLTIITTIFMPLSFIAGVYGMNFEHMPELNWRWGYPFALGVMAALGIGMLSYFKKKKWL
jgi:magnesium transporter